MAEINLDLQFILLKHIFLFWVELLSLFYIHMYIHVYICKDNNPKYFRKMVNYFGDPPQIMFFLRPMKPFLSGLSILGFLLGGWGGKLIVNHSKYFLLFIK